MTNEEFIASISTEGEEWRDVVGYEGLYVVSSYGRIISLGRTYTHGRRVTRIPNCLLKPTTSKRGKNYTLQEVKLYVNGKGKTMRVSTIVATAFLIRREDQNCVDHIDTNTSNNKVTNLRWCTYKENNNNPLSRLHNSNSKKGNTPNPHLIRQLVMIANSKTIYFDSIAEANRQGFARTQIYRCLKGERESFHNAKWMYLSDYELLSASQRTSLSNN